MPPSRTFTAEQIAWLKAQDAKGVPRSEIARQFTATFDEPITRQTVSKLLPPLTAPPAKNGDLIRVTLQVRRKNATKVRRLAAALGFTGSRGPGTGEGNLSALVEAIAEGSVELVPRK